eukprot:TRINITY_DN22739_c0_g1_i4.p1 TRINITY_DN22739_c0_g1~~TRINITY_DN22739_c0_g1_i4.p1  ORF type:complete len:477 (+),score=112.89 TRINITY_DN22739_c0_g1_i4:86-1432(+)
MLRSLVGSEMCIRDRYQRRVRDDGVASMKLRAASYEQLDTNRDGVVDRGEASLMGLRRPQRLVSRGKSRSGLRGLLVDDPTVTPQWHAGYFTVDLGTNFWKLLAADPFHTIVNLPTLWLVLVFVMTYGLMFLTFALIFWLIEHIVPDSFQKPGSDEEAFAICFQCSWQTLATVGYGTTYPNGALAQAFAALAVVISLLVDSFAVGIFYSNLCKASRKEEAIVCSKTAVIYGPPTQRFFECRVHHLASHPLVDPSIKLYLCRWALYPEFGTKEIDPKIDPTVDLLGGSEAPLLHPGEEDPLQGEGSRPQRPWQQGIDIEFSELELTNKSSRAFLQLPWCVRHEIGPESPLYHLKPDELHDIEILCVVLGTAASTGNTCEHRQSYLVEEMQFERCFVNVLSLDQDGRLDIDLDKFNDTVPWPWSGTADDKVTSPFSGLRNRDHDGPAVHH